MYENMNKGIRRFTVVILCILAVLLLAGCFGGTTTQTKEEGLPEEYIAEIVNDEEDESKNIYVYSDKLILQTKVKVNGIDAVIYQWKNKDEQLDSDQYGNIVVVETARLVSSGKKNVICFYSEKNVVYSGGKYYYEGSIEDGKELPEDKIIEGKDTDGKTKYFYNEFEAVKQSTGDKTVKYVFKEWHILDKDKFENLPEDTSSGVMSYVYMGIGKTLSFINSLVPSYIFALFVFAILVKILLFWFGWKQQKSMVKQAYFKPKERAIRNKYKGRTDKVTMQKMQQEIMEAQQKEGVSMFGGCLPLLIQFPIIIILYNVIRNPLSYVAEFSSGVIDAIKNVISYNSVTEIVGKSVQSLSELDMVTIVRDHADGFAQVVGKADGAAVADSLPNFYVVGEVGDLSKTPSFSASGSDLWYLLIPLITFVTLFLTMKLNKKLTAGASIANEEAVNNGMSMKIMDFAMPALSTWFTFMFPAVLGVYWIFNNLLGTVQQIILKKMLPFPVFTEEDYKRAEKEYNKGKDPKRSSGGAGGSSAPRTGSGRSLFHMDDEDYEAPAPKNNQSADKKAEEKKGMLGKATLKEDDTPDSNADDKAEENNADETETVNEANETNESKTEE